MLTGKIKLFSCLIIFFLFFPGFLLNGRTFSEPVLSAHAESVDHSKEESGNNIHSYQDYALLIAGKMNSKSSLGECEKTPSWIRFAKTIEQKWENFDKRQLVPMREWASQELNSTTTSAPSVFYPFSGPDFFSLYSLFLEAKTYLMVALEPVGELPDFSELDEEDFFPSLQQSLSDVLNLNFFITAKLRNNLQTGELKGVLPLLLFGLARQNVQVLDVQAWSMQPDGTIKEIPGLDRQENQGEGIRGVRIVFKNPNVGQNQTLYYFSFNLQDASFNRNPRFVSFLKNFGPFTTFTKAASYLMFNSNFSAIRQFVLDQSISVLQTDSGIPLKYFDPTNWNLKFYGDYTSPIPLFRNCYQPDKAKIFSEGEDIPDLPFNIGYFNSEHPSNLLFATKKRKDISDNVKNQMDRNQGASVDQGTN